MTEAWRRPGPVVQVKRVRCLMALDPKRSCPTPGPESAAGTDGGPLRSGREP